MGNSCGGSEMPKDAKTTQNHKSHKLELTYFNAKGRGEFVRLILEANGVDYKDNRVEFPDWPALKPKTPLGGVPYLTIDGENVPQVNAIVRTLGRMFEMYGKSEIEQYRVDVFLETIADLNSKSYAVFGIKDKEEQAKAFVDLQSNRYKEDFDRLEMLIGKYGKNGFAVGETMTIADLVLYHAIDLAGVGGNVAGYPKLKANREKVISSNSKLAKYIENRPQTAF